MDGEQRLILLLTLLGVILLSILGIVLLIAMWSYREIIGTVLISLLVLLFALIVGVTVNEQVLRHKRVKHQSEIPLDCTGNPLYLYKDMQPYHERHPHDHQSFNGRANDERETSLNGYRQL
jgi:hypothetical protein